jgi:methionine sulfoxide reductase heme-binding subunit
MQRRHLLQAAVIVLGLLPAVRLAAGLLSDDLGADPVETLTHGTGDWALRHLLASLAITPLRRLGLRVLAPLRRTLGLLAFFYVCAHLLVYVLLDQGLDPGFIWEDVREHPYVTAGFASFLCLVPLAITSTRGWIRRLGRRWIPLHRLVYVAAVAAVVHFIWLVKADLREPMVYAAVLAALFAVRIGGSLRARPTHSTRAHDASPLL